MDSTENIVGESSSLLFRADTQVVNTLLLPLLPIIKKLYVELSSEITQAAVLLTVDGQNTRE